MSEEVGIDLPSSLIPVSEDILFPNSDRHSSFGMATRYELDGLGIESQWRRSFRTLVDSFLAAGTGSFQGVKQPGRGADILFSSSAIVANGLELYPCLPNVSASACHGLTLGVPWPASRSLRHASSETATVSY
jgi:hypothetical protein